MIIGIICAMRQEYEAVKNSIMSPIEYCAYTFKISKGMISNVKVVIIHSGIGNIKSTLATQHLIFHENVTNVIVIGFAGSLQTSIKIGDLFIATHVIDNSSYKEYIEDSNVEIGTPFIQPMQTDNLLFDALCNACRNVPLYKGKVIDYVGKAIPTCHQGMLLTSDVPVLNNSIINRTVMDKYDLQCVDMESFGVYCACYIHTIPCASIRLISDAANNNSPLSILRSLVYLTEYMQYFISYLLKEIACKM